MDFAKHDFDYYERSVRLMYNKYYNKRMILLIVALVIILGYSLIFKETLVLNVLLGVILVGLLVYLFLQKQKFGELYSLFLAQNEPGAKIYQVEEDEYSYNIYDGNEKVTRINKKGVRNFPSQNKQYTMMVGFEKTFFAKEPLQIAYYDMLELRYEEKFRLTRNGYSSMPRFLRRFTPGNLKASAGNAVSFILGNLFGIFILIQLIRYLLSFLRMLF